MCVVGHGGFFGVRNFLNHFSFWLILMNCHQTANLSYDRQVVKHTLRYARTHWESKHNLDVFFLNDGYSGCSYPPEFEDEDYDLKLITDYEVYSDYSD